MQGDAAAHKMAPGRQPMWFRVFTNKDDDRTRIPMEPVRRREGLIVIGESRLVRRLTGCGRRDRYRRFGTVPGNPKLKCGTAPAEVIEQVAVRHFPPLSQMKREAPGEIGRHGPPIDGPGDRADRHGIEQHKQGDPLAKAMKLLGHLESDQSAHRISSEVIWSLWLE